MVATPKEHVIIPLTAEVEYLRMLSFHQMAAPILTRMRISLTVPVKVQTYVERELESVALKFAGVHGNRLQSPVLKTQRALGKLILKSNGLPCGRPRLVQPLCTGQQETQFSQRVGNVAPGVVV